MKPTLVFLLLLGATAMLSAARFHVSPHGGERASGRAWDQSTTLHSALRRARPGDQVWVARGTYVTSDAGDRRASFVVPAGVSLYGGFTGKERHLRQRPKSTRSTLSGELGRPHEAADNANTVVRLEARGTHHSLLDGFIITAGNAKSYTDGRGARSAGGGLFLLSNPQGSTRHAVANCTIGDNRAHNGAGVFVAGGQPFFSNCTFSGNTADFNGGAIYNDGSRIPAKPSLEACTFVDNASNSGAGMTNNGAGGEASPTITDCRFVDNISLINGAAIYNIKKAGGRCKPALVNCRFVGNESIIGDDVSTLGRGTVKAAAAAARPGQVGGTLRPGRY